MELSLVLLGLRSAWREDDDCTQADLVFGTNLRPSGKLFEENKNQIIPTSQFLVELKNHMKQLSPPTSAHHSQPASYIQKDLATVDAVYVRHNVVHGPLQGPYDGHSK